MRLALIVNPFASAVSEERVRAVEQELARAGEVRTVLTERAGHAVELAAGVEGEAIVVYSGDGGFNEVLNGVREGVGVGFLPGGGTNVLPRALGLPRDAVEAARQVADAVQEGRTRTISLGRVNGRRFAFAAGVGLDAELIRSVDALGRSADGKRPGDLAFLAAATRLLATRRGRLEPELDVRGLGRAAFVLVANTDPYTFVGSHPLHVAPERVTPANLPRLLRAVFSGRGQADAGDIVYAHDVDRVEVAADRPLPLQADGEDLGDIEAAVFEAERNALRVLI
jgi:diacylglycerol kinase family enzyme